jgi:rRNA maturation RNase YbeY
MKESSIFFFKEGVSFRINRRERLIKWILRVVRAEGASVGIVNFIFCGDPYLKRINKQYLSHDYFTDIVTFDNATGKNIVSGDIFISVDRVRSNAGTYAVSFDDELHRVMIHGILHLLGYRDKNRKQKSEMRAREDHWLQKRFPG